MSFLADTDPNVQMKFYDANNQLLGIQNRVWNASQTLCFQSAIVEVKEVSHAYSELKTYPNPTSNHFYADLSILNGESYRLRLFDFSGNEIARKTGANDATISYSLEAFPTGMYFFVIETESKSYSGKVIKY